MTEIDEIKRDCVFRLCSDYKMLRLMYGLGGASSTYCCIYCNVKQGDMLEFKECEKRTLGEMKEAARRLEELVKTWIYWETRR